MEKSMKVTTVNGIDFEVYSDFIARGTFATNKQTGETKQIQGNGYIHNDLTVRKAIALIYHLPTFRK
jgi:hypothetical protein